MNKNNIEELKKINLYESEIIQGFIQDKKYSYLTLEAMGLDVLEVLKDLSNLCDISNEHLSLREDFRKSKVKSVKINIKEKVEQVKVEQNEQYIKLKNKVLETGYIQDTTEINDPELLQRMMETNSLDVAHNQHSRVFNQTIKLLRKEPMVAELYEEELSKVNLSLKMVLALNKAIVERDKELYDKVRRVISTNFTKLPKAIEANNFSGVINGCIKRDAYIDNTHPYFNKVRSMVHHPEIFLCKAILSKVLNRV